MFRPMMTSHQPSRPARRVHLVSQLLRRLSRRSPTKRSSRTLLQWKTRSPKSPPTSPKMITGTPWKGGTGKSANPAATRNRLLGLQLLQDADVAPAVPNTISPPAGPKIARGERSRFVRKEPRWMKKLLPRRSGLAVQNVSRRPSQLRHRRSNQFWMKGDLLTTCSNVWNRPPAATRSRFPL